MAISIIFYYRQIKRSVLLNEMFIMLSDWINKTYVVVVVDTPGLKERNGVNDGDF